VAQTMYTHVNKCKNNKIKEKRMYYTEEGKIQSSMKMRHSL
jgi:hypothetical protein